MGLIQQRTTNTVKRAYIGCPDSYFTKTFVPKLVEQGPFLLIFISQKPFVLKPSNASFFLRFVLSLKANPLLKTASLVYWKYYTHHHHIPFLVFDSVNNPELIEYLKDKEFILSAGLHEKVSGDLLRACPNGLINFHYSLLPRYRGCFPVFWQCVQADLEFGYTFHKMNELFDAGPILFQNKMSISKESLNSENPVAAISDELTLHASNQIYKLVHVVKEFVAENKPASLFTKRDFVNFHKLNWDQSGLDWFEKCKFSKRFILQDRYLIHFKPAGISKNSTNRIRIKGISLIISKDYRNFIIQSINYLPAFFYYFQIKKIVRNS